MAFGGRHGEIGVAAAFALILVSGCTEPNPYLNNGEANDSSTGAATSTGPAMDSSGGTPTPGATTTGTGTTDTTAAGDTEASGCEARGMECIAAAPDGWTGPFAWLEADAAEDLGCAAPFTDQQTQVFSDLVAPAATCGCECEPLTDASCSGGQMIYYPGPGCSGTPDAPFNVFPGCNLSIGSDWDLSGSYEFVPPTVTSGSCDPISHTTVDPALFSTQHLACGGTFDEGDCGSGQLCADAPSDPYYPQWCVWQTGEVECPAGDYSVRTVLHQDVDDDRDCQECTCGFPSTPCMNTTLFLSTTTNCMGSSAGNVPAGGCTDGVGSIDPVALSHVVGSAQGQCEPAVVGPMGTAAEAEPVTFCCTG
ncbi:MAG: hypothetical protein AAF799_00450 [Myxococcota bacterium]